MPLASTNPPNTQPMPNKVLRFSGVDLEAENIEPPADLAASSVIASKEEDAIPPEMEDVAVSAQPTAAPQITATVADGEQAIDEISSAAIQGAGAAPAAAGPTKLADGVIRAFIRVRPPTASEIADGSTETIMIKDKQTVLLKAPAVSRIFGC